MKLMFTTLTIDNNFIYSNKTQIQNIE